VKEISHTHDLYGLRRKYTRLCTYVTIEYDPFPAVPPTTDVVDCYANIVLPAPPVVTDNCGVTLTPQVLLKQAALYAKATLHTHGHIRTAKEIHKTMFIQ
jgi:hypothetical protein